MIPILLLCLRAISDDSFERGMYLARAEQWEQARAAFARAQTAAPFDKRFPLELAGVEYRLGRHAAAQSHLRRALRLDPSDEYGNDFLATLYYLDGNYEAALVYWNRIGKPRLAAVEVEPAPPVPTVLLDRALMFAPGETVTLRGYRSTRARLESLDVFNRFGVDLASRPGQQFDARINWAAPIRMGSSFVGSRRASLPGCSPGSAESRALRDHLGQLLSLGCTEAPGFQLGFGTSFRRSEVALEAVRRCPERNLEYRRRAGFSSSQGPSRRGDSLAGYRSIVVERRVRCS